MKRVKRVSDYDSESLMYGLLASILQDDAFRKLKVAVHVPLRMIIRDFAKLDEQEVKYAANPLTHVDFLIYNQLNHMPVLAIEVDGTAYHVAGSKQAQRDRMKDGILTRYGIPMLRLKTNESGEERRIREKLRSILG